jgi:AcrR family transcriptional regulator
VGNRSATVGGVRVPEPVLASRLGSPSYRAAQMRVVTAALDLFVRYGVSGTSLQMIADAVGVTKAAVYHQFKTKEAIVVAAVELELGRLEAALDAAEAEPGPGALESLVGQVVDLAVARRRMVNTLLYDPVIVRLLAEHEPFTNFMDHLFRALLRGHDDAAARTRVAMVASAIGGAVTHPLVADLDDATLKAELLGLSLRFLDVEG